MRERADRYAPHAFVCGVLLIGATPFGSGCFAADEAPPQGTPPERPSLRETVPQPVPPSTMDPGIQKQPPTVPSSESAVEPPNVDPEMAIDPQTAPPASSPNLPRQYEPKKAPPPPR